MMEFIENKGLKYQILKRPDEHSYDYYVGVAKNHPDFFVLRNNTGFLCCKLIVDADLMTDDGYLYTSY